MPITGRHRLELWCVACSCLAAVPFACTPADEVPELANETDEMIFINASGSEPRASLIHLRNMDDVRKTLAQDPARTIPVLRNRVRDPQVPMTLRVLYAGMLACCADAQGQDFLIQRARQSTTFEEAQDAFWVMGHLHLLQGHKDHDSGPIDMRWAEEAIVAVLTSKATVSPRDDRSPQIPQAAIAVQDGDFANLLVDLKSKQACPVLMDLYERATWMMDQAGILFALGKLKDKRTIPLFVRNVRSPDTRTYFASIKALTDMGAPEVLPGMLTQLNRSETYYVLRRYPDASVLAAVERALPGLSNAYARGEAQLFIIDRRGGDRLPKLIALARDPTFRSRTDVMMVIQEMHDERAVPFTAELLRTSPDLHRRTRAISILASFKSPQAVKSLIDALDVDFQAVAAGKEVMRDNNEELRTRIAKCLETMTGQSFGTERAAWLKWYEATQAGK